jgi:hypothetical protein
VEKWRRSSDELGAATRIHTRGVRLGLAAGLVLAAVGLAGPGRADEPPPPSRDTRQQETRQWYGRWLLGADVVSDALILLPPQSQRTSSGLPGGVGYLGLAGVSLGAPVVHAWQGRPDRALGSFALRALALGAGILLHGITSSECWKEMGTACDRSERLSYLVPLAVVQLIDAAKLGWR